MLEPYDQNLRFNKFGRNYQQITLFLTTYFNTRCWLKCPWECLYG